MISLFLFACSSTTTKDTALSQLETVEGLHVSWHSVTTLSLRFADRLWLFDPFFSRPEQGMLSSNTTGKNRMTTALGMQVDRIFVGHSHFDHALDVRTAANHYGAPVYGSQTTCHLTGSAECQVVDQGWQAVLDGVIVTALRTPHWRPDLSGVGSYQALESPSDDLATAPNGGVISFHMVFPEGQRILIQDSMGGLDIDDGSGQSYRQNLDFVESNPIEYWFTCGDCLSESAELEAYVSLLKPSVVVPIHWDGVMANPAATPAWQAEELWTQVMTAGEVETQTFSGYATPMTIFAME